MNDSSGYTPSSPASSGIISTASISTGSIGVEVEVCLPGGLGAVADFGDCLAAAGGSVVLEGSSATGLEVPGLTEVFVAMIAASVVTIVAVVAVAAGVAESVESAELVASFAAGVFLPTTGCSGCGGVSGSSSGIFSAVGDEQLSVGFSLDAGGGAACDRDGDGVRPSLFFLSPSSLGSGFLVRTGRPPLFPPLAPGLLPPAAMGPAVACFVAWRARGGPLLVAVMAAIAAAKSLTAGASSDDFSAMDARTSSADSVSQPVSLTRLLMALLCLEMSR